MKIKKKYILVIFIFSVLIMIIGSAKGYIKGHDTDFHASNIEVIASKLSINNLLVQEPLKEILNNFGYGTRFFYPPLPHLTASYITKFLSITNLGNVSLGMRITQGVTFFASGIAFFYLAIKIFKNQKIALVLALFYMSVPYHLTEVFIRDAFSEMFIPIAIPLILLGLIYLTEKDYKHFLIFFVLGYTIAIYSHIAMSVYFTFIILITFFPIYFKEIFTKKNMLYLLLASVLILLLTASFWVVLLEIKIKGGYPIFVPYLLTAKGDLRFSALKIYELIKPTIFHDGNMIFHLPYFMMIMFLGSVFLAIKNKLLKEKIWLFIFLFTILSTLMVTNIFPWKYIPAILQTLQFPWRLTLYIEFGAILFIGIFIKNFENFKSFNTFIIILILLNLFSCYFYIGHVDKPILDENSIEYELGAGNEKEYLPERAFRNKRYVEERGNDILVKSGNGDIEKVIDDVPLLEFRVQNVDGLIIELPRLYYYGYKLNLENRKRDRV